jgi:hypothetical protein
MGSQRSMTALHNLLQVTTSRIVGSALSIRANTSEVRSAELRRRKQLRAVPRSGEFRLKGTP